MGKKHSIGVFLLVIVGAGPAHASEQVLHNFPDQSYPVSNLVEIGTGTFFGTTYDLSGFGTAFRMSQKPSGWRFKTVHAFDGTDGSNPLTGFVYDKPASTLYGVTSHGGSDGLGTVFSLNRSGELSVLHSFSRDDGSMPSANLLQDKQSGTLYGTTIEGGQYDCGTFFSLRGDGSNWTFNTLHSFEGGCGPISPLVEGPARGVLIGSTYKGGASNDGTLFALTDNNGTWTESLIHSFGGAEDGIDPYDLVRGKDGTIYGVAKYGGPTNLGAAFKLVFKNGLWTYKVIHGFSNAAGPVALFLDDHSHGLYGVSDDYGGQGNGTVFELQHIGTQWQETILHYFAGGSDGSQPEGRPIFDSNTGILYGTTSFGGKYNGGIVYAISPQPNVENR